MSKAEILPQRIEHELNRRIADALKKVQFSDIQGKPTTLQGYGITNVTNINGVSLKGYTLTGVIDGANKTFVFPVTIQVGSEMIFLNGQKLVQGVGYTISGNTVTLTNTPNPASGGDLADTVEGYAVPI